ncbi:MAG: hypothetical protein ACRERE_38775 [Candidatus Entotheonellia bacterium]
MSENGMKKVYSNYLRLEEAPEGFAISLGDELLKTPAGHLVCSSNESLLLHMIGELEQYPVLTIRDGMIEHPRLLCAYLLYSTQKDFVEAGQGIPPDEIPSILDADPIFHPSAGPEWGDQRRAWEPLAKFFAGLGHKLRPRARYSEDDWYSLCQMFFNLWQSLDTPQKAVVENLIVLLDHQFVASVALVTRSVNDTEYANAEIRI